MAASNKYQKTPEEFADEIKKILSANVSKSIHLMTRANNLLKDTVESIASSNKEPVDKSELLNRWLNFNVATYTVINDHTISLLEKLITIAEGSIIGKTQETTAEEKNIDINITGHQGEKQSTFFLIKNHYDNPLDISFEASPLIAEGTQLLPNRYITFDPSTTTLKEREEKTIKVIVDINEDFIPGKTYITNIHVIGYETKELILSIEVLPPLKKNNRTGKKRNSSSKKKASGTPKNKKQQEIKRKKKA